MRWWDCCGSGVFRQTPVQFPIQRCCNRSRKISITRELSLHRSLRSKLWSLHPFCRSLPIVHVPSLLDFLRLCVCLSGQVVILLYDSLTRTHLSSSFFETRPAISRLGRKPCRRYSAHSLLTVRSSFPAPCPYVDFVLFPQRLP